MTFGPYPALVSNVHDGDTVTLDYIDLGFDHIIMGRDAAGKTRLSCRLVGPDGQGFNAPELSTDAGKTAAAYAKTLLPVGTAVHVLSYGWDAYGGRFDGAITLPDGSDFATAMVDSGNAVWKAY